MSVDIINRILVEKIQLLEQDQLVMKNISKNKLVYGKVTS